MAHRKVSITLETDVANQLRAVAGPRGVSAFVNEAVRQKLQARRLQTLMDDMESEFGPVPQDVQREVDALPWPT